MRNLSLQDMSFRLSDLQCFPIDFLTCLVDFLAVPVGWPTGSSQETKRLKRKGHEKSPEKKKCTAQRLRRKHHFILFAICAFLRADSP